MNDLRSAIQEYVELRQALGFCLREHRKKLNDFADFLEAHEAPIITTRLAVEWARKRSEHHPSTHAQRLSLVRGFARHYSAIEPATEVPPFGILPGKLPRKSPYIYTDEDVRKLMEAAQSLRAPKGVSAEDALRPWTYSTMFGLFAVTGLRLGEVLRLEREAVDLAQAQLTVRQTKFGKTRLVPIHETTVDALKRYAARRDRVHPRPRTPHFFVKQRGGPLDQRTFKTEFIQLSRQIGLRGEGDHHGPRIHDLRHSFAVKTVMRWYQEGVDVAQRMPVLCDPSAAVSSWH